MSSVNPNPNKPVEQTGSPLKEQFIESIKNNPVLTKVINKAIYFFESDERKVSQSKSVFQTTWEKFSSFKTQAKPSLETKTDEIKSFLLRSYGTLKNVIHELKERKNHLKEEELVEVEKVTTYAAIPSQASAVKEIETPYKETTYAKMPPSPEKEQEIPYKETVYAKLPALPVQYEAVPPHLLETPTSQQVKEPTQYAAMPSSESQVEEADIPSPTPPSIQEQVKEPTQYAAMPSLEGQVKEARVPPPSPPMQEQVQEPIQLQKEQELHILNKERMTALNKELKIGLQKEQIDKIQEFIKTKGMGLIQEARKGTPLEEGTDKEKVEKMGITAKLIVLNADKQKVEQDVELEAHATSKGNIFVNFHVLGAGQYKVTKEALMLSSFSREILENPAFAVSEILPLTSDPLMLQPSEKELELKNEVMIQKHVKIESEKNPENFSNVSCSHIITNGTDQTLLSPFCNGGNLEEYIVKKSKEYHPLSNTPEVMQEKYEIAANITRGVLQLHQTGIIHRDLKPDNLLLTKDGNGKVVNAKVIDFGKSTFVEDVEKRYHTDIFALPYLAPEANSDTVFSYEIDKYSLGVVLYRLLADLPAEQLATKLGQHQITKVIKNPDGTTSKKVEVDWASLDKTKCNPASWPGMDRLNEEDRKIILRLLSPPQINPRTGAITVNRANLEEVVGYFEKKGL